MGTATRSAIAIVDDDEGARQALAYLLEVLERSTECFQSATEFLASGPGHFRALILDQHMPMMTGLELVHHLRSTNVDIPTMLLSGNLTPLILQKAMALGIQRVSEKPPKVDELTTFLDSAMG